MEEKILQILDTLDDMDNPSEAMSSVFNFPTSLVLARTFAKVIEKEIPVAENSEELSSAKEFFAKVPENMKLPSSGELSSNFSRVKFIGADSAGIAGLNGAFNGSNEGYAEIKYLDDGTLIASEGNAFVDLIIRRALVLYKNSDFNLILTNLKKFREKKPENADRITGIIRMINEAKEYMMEHKGTLSLTYSFAPEDTMYNSNFKMLSENVHEAVFSI